MGEKFRAKLDQNWKVSIVPNEKISGELTRFRDVEKLQCTTVPAQVPGNFELDLVRQGLLEDPYYGKNVLSLQEFETCHVFYGVEFEYDKTADENTVLLFEGIDTIADIYLNGEKTGHAENMFIPHEFPAGKLRKGMNELMVHIFPACLEARKYDYASTDRSLKYNYESLVIRKAAHSFGWDICPRIVSAGLWKPVWIVQKKEERIEDVFIYVQDMEDNRAINCAAVFRVFIGQQHVRHFSIGIEGKCGDSKFDIKQRLWFVNGCIEFRIENPKLWWPRNYGEPNRYDIKVTLYKDGKPVDVKEFKHGFRLAELVHDDYIDENDRGDFFFRINKKKIFIKGTNWVPADAFHSNDPNRIPAILDLIWDIGCNAVRCWGGGVYEDDSFYEWCDAHGIIVWQDFMMACAVYPQSEQMKAALREEAVAVVRRLRNHACICLWAGDNECDEFYVSFKTGINPAENELTRKVISGVLRQEDISRPYLPSSPYISRAAFEAGKVLDTPEQHLWGPRDYFKGEFYHGANATFASEIGYHGCPSPESIKKFISPEKLWPPHDNDEWIIHAASPEVEDSPYSYRIPLMTGQIACFFRQEPRSLEEYAYMSQIVQAEAFKFFVESFRSRKWRRTGIIWWNIMDCWPQFSDAVVDYYFCKKLAYHYIRRSQENICLMMDDHTGELVLYGVNDTQEDVHVTFSVVDADTDEVIVKGKTVIVADSSTALYTIHDSSRARFYWIKWETDGRAEGFNHYLHGKPLYDYDWYVRCMKKIGMDQFEGF